MNESKFVQTVFLTSRITFQRQNDPYEASTQWEEVSVTVCHTTEVGGRILLVHVNSSKRIFS